MRHIFSLILSLTALYGSAQNTTAEDIENGHNGMFLVTSSKYRVVENKKEIERGDLKILNANSPSVRRFSVPAVFAVPAARHFNPRRKIRDYAGTIKVDIKNLEEKDGALLLEFDMGISGLAMNKRLNLMFFPELKDNTGNRMSGPALLVNGRIRQRVYDRRMKFDGSDIPAHLPNMEVTAVNHEDTLYKYRLKLPYEQWMDYAVLNIHQVLGSPANTEQLYTLSGVGQVTLEPVEVYEVSPIYSFIVPEREQKTRNMQGQAFLDFPAGRSAIIANYRRNPEELAKIESALQNIRNNPDVEITGLFIEGYASPEGSYDTNHRLAQERSQALADYLVQSLRVERSIITVNSVGEDWDGLRSIVEESNIERRDVILAIINGQDEPDRKEQRLKSMGTVWSNLLNNYFPQLRRVEYQIDFSVKDYSVEESRELAGRNPELLSHRELFLLAESCGPGTAEQEKLFETMIRLYPDDPVAIINYSSLLLGRGEVAAAGRYLERVKDDPRALNNTGIYLMVSGELVQAESYLERAAAGGNKESLHNCAELQKKRENELRLERLRNR